MRGKRTWLGLLVAILTAVLLWWSQGDGAEPTSGEDTAPSDTPSVQPLPTETVEPTEQISATPADGTDPESGLPLVAVADLPQESATTLKLIDEGGPFPYDRDGITFENREGILPDQADGYYREYTVETPGSDDRGARRIVTGSGGEFYWTENHYASFERIVR
ncbi:MAG: ribonuclease domain-containing protein [Nocardioides sp.]